VPGCPFQDLGRAFRSAAHRAPHPITANKRRYRVQLAQFTRCLGLWLEPHGQVAVWLATPAAAHTLALGPCHPLLDNTVVLRSAAKPWFLAYIGQIEGALRGMSAG